MPKTLQVNLKFIAISTWNSEAHGGDGNIQMLPQQSHKSDVAASRARQLRRSTQPPPSQGGRGGISCHHLGVWPPVKYGGAPSELRRRVAAKVSRCNVTTSALKCHDFIISSLVGRRTFIKAKLCESARTWKLWSVDRCEKRRRQGENWIVSHQNWLFRYWDIKMEISVTSQTVRTRNREKQMDAETWLN